MKYDRPVWQLMHACADAMPEVFRYDDVHAWFEEHFPDVNEATIRAHLIGLTEGGRTKHVQFAQRSPVFRRVARGEYSAIPVTERGEDPDVTVPPSSSTIKMSGNGDHPVPAPPPAPAAKVVSPAADADPSPMTVDHRPDVILLGSLGERVNVPAPAKEIFREVSFQRRRLDAELSGSEWFVLSAEHGLVAPNEWMSPDSRTLDDMDPSYRTTWAAWVVARLQSLVGSLEGTNVRIEAPASIIGPLFADLQAAGAVVSSGEGAVTTVVAEPVPVAKVAAQDVSRDVVHPVTDAVPPTPVEGHGITSIDHGSPVGRHLADPDLAVPARRASSLPTSPGLYGWIVDPIGARVLNRCLRLPVRPGLVFVGQVGGSSWRSTVDPVLNLRDHVDRVQLHGRTRASTFRMTLATVLRDHLEMTTVEDRSLTAWMLEHLSVSVWPTDGAEGLGELLQLVVTELDPPLNVDHLPATEYRARLQQMRSAPA